MTRSRSRPAHPRSGRSSVKTVGGSLLALTLLAACRPVSTPPASSPTPTATVTPAARAGGAVASTYHGVLMLEKAADLLLAGIEKVQAGQIPPADISAISSYTKAFPLAVEYLGQST